MTDIYCVLDTETTALEEPIGVVEVAWQLLTPDLDLICKFDTLVDPGMPIPADASEVNGIYDKDVEFAPLMSEVEWPDCEVILVCHNTPYDEPLVAPYLNIVGRVCTMRHARRMWPSETTNHKMQTLIKEFGLTATEEMGSGGDRSATAHAAAGDVKSLVELIKYMDVSLPQMREEQLTPHVFETMPIGKMKGRHCKEVAPSFWEWVLSKDFDEDMIASARYWLGKR